ASAFNTPLGGVIFAIEELAKVHISHVRTYAFHAVIMAGMIAQAVMGNYLYFGRIAVVFIQLHEIFPLILATAFIGFMGAVFGRAVVACLDFRARQTVLFRAIFTILFGLLVAAMSVYFGKLGIGSGRGVIIDLFNSHGAQAQFWLGPLRGLSNLF